MFLFLTFRFHDLPLLGLLLIFLDAYFIGNARQGAGALAPLAGATLGKGARLLRKEEGRMKNAEFGSEIRGRMSKVGMLLVGLVALLAFSSWWHPDMSANFYHGPRWMGLWNNLNVYGMLMSAWVALACGMLAGWQKEE